MYNFCTVLLARAIRLRRIDYKRGSGLAERNLAMNENVKQLSIIQQIRDEFRIVAITALVATAAIWLYVSINFLWTAVLYFGFLLTISLIYGTINYCDEEAEAVKEIRE